MSKGSVLQIGKYCVTITKIMKRLELKECATFPANDLGYRAKAAKQPLALLYPFAGKCVNSFN